MDYQIRKYLIVWEHGLKISCGSIWTMGQSLNILLLLLPLLLKLFSQWLKPKKDTKEAMFKKFTVEFDIPWKCLRSLHVMKNLYLC